MTFEIWLNDSRFLFDRGVAYNDDGGKSVLKSITEISHCGAERLIVQVSDDPLRKPMLSWYSKFGILEPETWDSSVERIIFHNTSNKGIYIWHYAFLKPGQSAEIIRMSTHHDELLDDYRPLGMGTLLLMTRKDSDYDTMRDQHGLILYRYVSSDSPYVRVRFILEGAVSGSVLPDTGFETSSGELYLDDDAHVRLNTAHSKYMFKLDPL